MNPLLTTELSETLTNFKVWVCNPTHSAFPQSPKYPCPVCLWQSYSHQLMIMIGIKRKT